ncbi:MAG: TrbI/VirB10 family protein [Candidatus Aminicenantes bacterium]|nr:TrbI/VirB10 family protein [Candidatus Aminicenantes bacterium]
MSDINSNFVNIEGIKKHRKRIGSKMKDRLVMVIGGFVIFILTYFLYGIVDESENGPGENKVRTENRDLLAQIDLFEEQKKTNEEKFGMIRNDVFLGENAAVDEYADSIISDLRKLAKQEDEKRVLEEQEADSINREFAETESNDQFGDIMDYLQKEDESSGELFSEPQTRDVSSTGRSRRGIKRDRVGTLFAFSNTQRSARIYNNGRGEVVYNNADDIDQSGADKVQMKRELSNKKQLIFNSNPVFTIFEGEFLHAVLTNRIVNDKQSSPVTAVITKDLLDHTGKFVLIPANSKITGSAQKVSGQQDKRLFISFQRLILPNGHSLNFGSGNNGMTALDGSGALGIKGKKDSHFFAKFGSSILYGSLNGLSGFAQNKISQSSGLSHFIDRTSDNFNTLNDRLASDSLAILPTITVKAGIELKIRFSTDIEISAYSKISERSYY